MCSGLPCTAALVLRAVARVPRLAAIVKRVGGAASPQGKAMRPVADCGRHRCFESRARLPCLDAAWPGMMTGVQSWQRNQSRGER